MHVKAKQKNIIPSLPDPKSLTPQPSEDKELFEKLRLLRRDLAQEEHMPPYIIFSDKTLHELAIYKPISVNAFGVIYGVGENKKMKYGARFIQCIQEYISSSVPATSVSHMQEQKEQFANAYAKWTEKEDKELMRLYQRGFKPQELSIIFERNIGSINSRLAKLGLK